MNTLLSSKQVLNEDKDKYQPHERRLIDLINTKLSKLTKMRNVRQKEEFIWKSCEWKGEHKAYCILQMYTDRI